MRGLKSLNRALSALLASIYLFGSALAGDEDSTSTWPIRIENGEFVDASGRAFAPRGFNYIRLAPGRGHNTFDPESYNGAEINQALERWQADGFNVVRVFLNGFAQQRGSMASRGRPGLSAGYIANVADFLDRARRHDIAVMLCTESFPRVAPYSDKLTSVPSTISRGNAEYLDSAHIDAKARYLSDLISALRSARPGCPDAVFSYDLQNELCFQASAPFTLDTGTVVAANGQTYRLPDQRQQLADDSVVYFINRLADAIHQVHPTALVSASVFTYAAVGRSGPGDFTVKQARWQNRIPFRPRAILDSKADFLDLHFYSANVPALERDLVSVEFEQVRRLARRRDRPLFVGEFGAFKSAFAAPDAAAEWMTQLTTEFTKRGFAGWLYWTYDTHEQDNQLWHACKGPIYQALSAAK